MMYVYVRSISRGMYYREYWNCQSDIELFVLCRHCDLDVLDDKHTPV